MVTVNTIQVADLLPGDILLHRPSGEKLHQKMISHVTGSPYTHVSICIGSDEIAEMTLAGLRVRNISSTLESENQIGVQRSQLVFGHQRINLLRSFVSELLDAEIKYDPWGFLHYASRKFEFTSNELRILQARYGEFSSHDELVNRKYFCSAFIVACFCVVGIISESAQIAYLPDLFSPADLHSDPTFGWVLGYLEIPGRVIDKSDQLSNSTLWQEAEEVPWWRGFNLKSSTSLN